MKTFKKEKSKSPEEVAELLNNNPLWSFIYQMATTGRPLRDIEIIALLEINGLKKVSRANVSIVRKSLGVAVVPAKGRVALSKTMGN